ncbi:MAG: M56 family metallopeptidase [Maricaulaceae bacterium]|jgi:beta-lactamase regulating signal transducer with metallopeptidase domain
MADAAVVFSLIGNHLWQGGVLVAALALALRAGRRLRAKSRHDFAYAALACAALLPLAALAPGQGLEQLGWRLPLMVPEAEAASADDGVGAETEMTNVRGRSFTLGPNGPLVRVEIATTGSEAAAASPEKTIANLFDPRLAAWLAIGLGVVWVLGTLALLVRVAADAFAAEQLRARARPIAPPSLLSAELKQLRLAESAEARGPLVAGLTRPAVILPKGALDRYSAAQLSALLEHERSHIERGDLILAFVQRLLVAVFWWSPAMHWISRRIEDEREMACDEAAVVCTGDHRLLARTLADHAHAQLQGARPRLVMGMARRRSLLVRRVRRLMDGAATESRTLARGAAAALATVVLAAGLATPRWRAEASQEIEIAAHEDHLADHDMLVIGDLVVRRAETLRPQTISNSETVSQAIADWREAQARIIARAIAENDGEIDEAMAAELDAAADELGDRVTTFILQGEDARLDRDTALKYLKDLRLEEYLDAARRAFEASASITVLAVDKQVLVEARARARGDHHVALAAAHGHVADELTRLLVIAEADGDAAFAEDLIAAGADVTAARMHRTPQLIAAIRSGEIDRAGRLLAAGADVDAVDLSGNTLLRLAIHNSDEELVALLIDHDADVNAAGPDGLTPLALAAAARDEDIVRLLRDAGARLTRG